ncbi:glycosyltransferase [Aquitalea sp. ASV11]|uniref:glycosyltransferase n=1 Tax=Aquitalea sp. ASV11 TaxID=2795103 RepID=UPI002105D352|nr:glycosyltransferase [Aquitalea sp. ASV11]
MNLSTLSVILIPTFRRPVLLRKLLNSLQSELLSKDVAIVIGDNDCGVDVPAIVEEYKSLFSNLTCIPVPERGISQVRNALVQHAVDHFPAWEYLIMLDDDGFVMPGWFSSLFETINMYPAEVYGGPVLGDIPRESNIFARNSLYAARSTRSTGYVDILSGAQNIVISRSIESYIDYPFFDMAYGLSGGEDYAFFRRLRAKDARFAWSADAYLTEPTPVERLQVKKIIGRYYTTGKYMASIDRSFDGTLLTIMNAVKGFLGSILKCLKNLLLIKKNEFASSFLMLAHFSGRLMGVTGSRSSRYS